MNENESDITFYNGTFTANIVSSAPLIIGRSWVSINIIIIKTKINETIKINTDTSKTQNKISAGSVTSN